MDSNFGKWLDINISTGETGMNEHIISVSFDSGKIIQCDPFYFAKPCWEHAS